MQLPSDSIIPEDKITRYLLVPRIKDDKSKFLAQAGFTQENPEELLLAIRQLAATNIDISGKHFHVVQLTQNLTNLTHLPPSRMREVGF